MNRVSNFFLYHCRHVVRSDIWLFIVRRRKGKRNSAVSGVNIAIFLLQTAKKLEQKYELSRTTPALLLLSPDPIILTWHNLSHLAVLRPRNQGPATFIFLEKGEAFFSQIIMILTDVLCSSNIRILNYTKPNMMSRIGANYQGQL